MYRNSYGELAEDAVSGFRRFGMAAHADLIEEAFDHFERPIPLDRMDRWRMLEARLQPGTPPRSATTLDGVEWYSEIATKLTVLIGDVEDRYFALKSSQPGILETLARIVDERKDSFFARLPAGA